MRKSHQNGNVLFLILIAVILFAALSYAVTQSMRSDGEGVDQESRTLASSNLVQYGSSINQALLRLTLSGTCSDTEISFERAPFDGSDTDYFNPNSPADFSCHVFHPNGGGISYQEPAEGLNDGSEAFIHDSTCVPAIGTGYATDQSTEDCGSDGLDLILFVPNIDLDTCLDVNNRAGIRAIDGAPPQDHSGAWTESAIYKYFNGDYRPGGFQITDQSGNHSFDGKNYGCFEGGGTPVAETYHFYYVVLER